VSGSRRLAARRQWQVGHYSGLTSSQWFDHVNEARKTLATILGGLVVLAGGFATWRNLKLAQESLRVSQEGQITDRFTKAIEQLGAVEASGKKKLEVRLGGIYALERIANQSERDHWPIVEVLTTYIRENARREPQESTHEDQASPSRPSLTVQGDILKARPPNPYLAADFQAILTVLGRRDRKYEGKDQHLDLTNTEIRGANLTGAYLNEANLTGANLSGADLNGANLNWEDLSGVYLAGANLTGANLFAANLSGANLSDARGLTQQQLDSARGTTDTELPKALHMPGSWGKRE
jgi:hypothetical protein